MDALVGTVIGGLLAIFGGLSVKAFEEWRSKRSLRGAFRAEIGSIVRMMELRGHERLLQELLEHWKAGRRGRPRLLGTLTPQVDTVFAKNSDKIGLLGAHAAGEVVRFYSIMDGIRDDIRSLAIGELEQVPEATRVRLLEEDLRLWGQAKEIAARLQRTL